MEAKQSKDIPERILSLTRVDSRETTVVILLGVGGLVAIITSSRTRYDRKENKGQCPTLFCITRGVGGG